MIYATKNDTVYIHFAVNDTAGSAIDGSSAAAYVRQMGAVASAAPVGTPTVSLLSNASYPAGCYEIAIDTSAVAFTAGEKYAVFANISADSQTPAAIVGYFQLDPVIANAVEISDNAAAADNVEANIGNLNAAVADVEADTQAILADTGTDGVVLTSAERTAIVSALLAAVVEDSETFQQTLRIIRAYAAGKSNGGGSGTHNFRDKADTKNRITATVDAQGNRTAVSTDGT